MAEHYLGIDVGYSNRNNTTGLCLITVDQVNFGWRLLNIGTHRNRRLASLRDFIPQNTALCGVGIDGPLMHELELHYCYRPAESVLSRGSFQKRCKPGQTNSLIGLALHFHATQLANLILQLQNEGHLTLAGSRPGAIHDYHIVETFPTAFLAFMLSDNDFGRLADDYPNGTIPRDEKSDRYWEEVVANGNLHGLVDRLAPGRALEEPLDNIGGDVPHEPRAAFICALSAMCVAKNKYVAVGAQDGGDIILPPREMWRGGWVEAALRANVDAVASDSKQKNPCQNFNLARVIRNGRYWMVERRR